MFRRSPWLAFLLIVLAGCPKRPAPTARTPIPRYDVHAHLAPQDLPHAMQIYARNGIQGAVNLSGGLGPVLRQQLEAAAPYGGKVAVFCGLLGQHFLEPEWVDVQTRLMRQAKQLGARGLKIHKALGLGYTDPTGRLVPVDDPRLDPIFDEAAKLGFPVFIHTGDPKAFFSPSSPENERYDELKVHPEWSFADRALFPTWEELFAQFERRLARSPATTFIGVHFGNDPEDPARVARLLREHPNLVIDTAARVPEIGRMNPDTLRAIFLEHRRRILFGTDFALDGGEMMLGSPDGHPPTEADADRFFQTHWRFFETADRAIAHPTPIQGRWTVDALGLPEEILHDLYHRNAERLLGLPPLGVSDTMPSGSSH